METIQHIKLPIDYDIGDFDVHLAQRYAYKEDDTSIEHWTFYDTFDWRLFSKSLLLQVSGNEVILRRLPDGEKIAGARSLSHPRFAWDLPDGILKDELLPIIEVRALLKLAEIDVHNKTYHILNKDQKTVARIMYTQVGKNSKSVSYKCAHLSLKPVRGYPKYARLISKYLVGFGEISFKWEDIYNLALLAGGKEPGSYSSKIDIQLDPDMPSAEATKIILNNLYNVIRANEAGIRSDIDIEFLHDYRVAIRRTRSALSQIRNVFPTDITTRFKQDFAYLGKFTNMLRDLDVYLMYEDRYREMLPDELRSDIQPLFDYLRAQREQALYEVIQTLDSGNYQRVLLDWEAFLHKPAPENSSATNASSPIIDLANQRIYKHYRRVLKDGDNIIENPQDEMMHKLRIECKKLRYLIEFFASLYPPKKVARLVKQLKILQDNLGDFNDLSVQQSYLLNIAEMLPSNDMQTRRALIATGFLVDRLAHQQQTVKAAFEETFLNFASATNQRLFRRLFTPPGNRKDQ